MIPNEFPFSVTARPGSTALSCRWESPLSQIILPGPKVTPGAQCQRHNPRENIPLLMFLLNPLVGLRTSRCPPSLVGPQPPCSPPAELGLWAGFIFEAGSGCWARAITQQCLSKPDPSLEQSVPQRPRPQPTWKQQRAPFGDLAQSCWWCSKNCD